PSSILPLSHTTSLTSFFSSSSPSPPHLHSFPTRRSSDLDVGEFGIATRMVQPTKRGSADDGPIEQLEPGATMIYKPKAPPATEADRKSTRLNSSHQIISYAVFCLKKKKKTTRRNQKK